tara:strand:- start:651 stop:875 length:225 start_codon:yes stop_codon:yes gene_type:complete
MAFKMKYKNLGEVVKELRGAVKAHGKQADTIEKHIDDMGDSPMKKKGPCWKGYEMIGMKSKGGRKVPNCVPKKK